MRLSELRAGERCRLCPGCLDDADRALLCAMGLNESCEIRICRRGEPCVVRVRSTRLGLSAELARRILVQRTASTGP